MIPEWIPLIPCHSGIDTGTFHNPWNFAKPVYNHSTVPSLGEPVGPVRKLYLSYFRGLIIPIRRLYPPNQFTRPISRRPVPAGRLYLPVCYTGLFLSAFRTCLSIIQVSFFQLFVPAYLLYKSLGFSFSYLPTCYTRPFLPVFRTCLFIVHFPFFQLFVPALLVVHFPFFQLFTSLSNNHHLIYLGAPQAPLSIEPPPSLTSSIPKLSNFEGSARTI
jgi:hypothetical protein